MSDLVERLREVAERPDANYPAIMEWAAARIEQLEAALRDLGDHNRFGWTMQTEIARVALEEACSSS